MRDCPFKIGNLYRVRRDFKALRESFKADEVLRYKSEAYSCYDGYTGYFFWQTSTKGIKVWDIADGEDVGIWRELFEPLDEAEKPPA